MDLTIYGNKKAIVTTGWNEEVETIPLPGYFDRFDICAAWYWFAYDYHSGQFSKLYKVLGRLINMGFKISPLHNSIQDENFNAKNIYEALVIKSISK